MKSCPACSKAVEDSAIECPYCGVVFSKWRGRAAPGRPAASAPPPTAASRTPTYPGATTRRSSSSGIGRLLTLGLIGGLGVAGAYWWVDIRPRMESLEVDRQGERRREGTISARRDPVSDFDRQLDLPGGPRGMAWNGRQLLVGNRVEPWGFLRLTPAGEDSFEVESIEVLESTYNQRVGFGGVTWNGTSYIAFTSGDWFQSSHESVFTELDAESLEIQRYVEAPPLLGAVEWDGSGYWAATRRNTRDTDEPAYLYRLVHAHLARRRRGAK